MRVCVGAGSFVFGWMGASVQDGRCSGGKFFGKIVTEEQGRDSRDGVFALRRLRWYVYIIMYTYKYICRNLKLLSATLEITISADMMFMWGM